jgi:hypothetical protein
VENLNKMAVNSSEGGVSLPSLLLAEWSIAAKLEWKINWIRSMSYHSKRANMNYSMSTISLCTQTSQHRQIISKSTDISLLTLGYGGDSFLLPGRRRCFGKLPLYIAGDVFILHIRREHQKSINTYSDLFTFSRCNQASSSHVNGYFISCAWSHSLYQWISFFMSIYIHTYFLFWTMYCCRQ